MFTEYSIGCIDTKIKFLSPSWTNLHAFLDLVARQQRKKPKFDHISWYIWDRVIILGSIPPFSTTANMTMTSELSFDEHRACEQPIHNFLVFTIVVESLRGIYLHKSGMGWDRLQLQLMTLKKRKKWSAKIFHPWSTPMGHAHFGPWENLTENVQSVYMANIGMLVHYSGVFWREKSNASIHFTIWPSWKPFMATPILDRGKIWPKMWNLYTGSI